MADDPLLDKLDRLMRQMERGELLEEDDSAVFGASTSPNSNRGRRRQRAAPRPFKDWNSQTTSGTLQEYDALRDPHCRFTKQKQFKKQYNRY